MPTQIEKTKSDDNDEKDDDNGEPQATLLDANKTDMLDFEEKRE